MRLSILPAARQALMDIWRYTDQQWGEAQADAYVRGLLDAVEGVVDESSRWRTFPDTDLAGVYFFRYRQHYIFFRQLAEGHLGIVAILHGSRDVPRRLREVLGPTDR